MVRAARTIFGCGGRGRETFADRVVHGVFRRWSRSLHDLEERRRRRRPVVSLHARGTGPEPREGHHETDEECLPTRRARLFQTDHRDPTIAPRVASRPRIATPDHATSVIPIPVA